MAFRGFSFSGPPVVREVDRVSSGEDPVARGGQRPVALRNKTIMVFPTGVDWPCEVDVLREQDLFDAGWIRVGEEDVPLVRVSLALEELANLLRRRDDESVTAESSRGVVEAISDLVGNIRQRRNLAAGPTPTDTERQPLSRETPTTTDPPMRGR